MMHAFINADMVSHDTSKICEEVENNCKVRRMFRRMSSRPKSTLLKATGTNMIVASDLKEIKTGYIIWLQQVY